MGTPPIAAQVLEIINNKYSINTIYTKPPRASNRGLKLTPSAVQRFADLHNLPVKIVKGFKKKDIQEEFINNNFDLAIVVAFGAILPKEIFNSPKYGTINLHGSLLPRWRGAAPIERCIEAGDSQTGPTIMYIAEELDAGDIIYQQPFALTTTTTATDVYQNMATIGAELILKFINNLQNHHPIPRIAQNHQQVTYAKMLTKEEGELDFNIPAHNIVCKINAFNRFPQTYFYYQGELIKIIRAQEILPPQATDFELPTDNIKPATIVVNNNQLFIATSTNWLEILEIQKSGKKPLVTREFLKGFKFNIPYI